MSRPARFCPTPGALLSLASQLEHLEQKEKPPKPSSSAAAAAVDAGEALVAPGSAAGSNAAVPDSGKGSPPPVATPTEADGPHKKPGRARKQPATAPSGAQVGNGSLAELRASPVGRAASLNLLDDAAESDDDRTDAATARQGSVPSLKPTTMSASEKKKTGSAAAAVAAAAAAASALSPKPSEDGRKSTSPSDKPGSKKRTAPATTASKSGAMAALKAGKGKSNGVSTTVVAKKARATSAGRPSSSGRADKDDSESPPLKRPSRAAAPAKGSQKEKKTGQRGSAGKGKRGKKRRRGASSSDDDSDESDDSDDDDDEDDEGFVVSDGDASADDSDDNDDKNDDTCTRCGDAGDLVCCDSCPRSYHMECVVPPMLSLPEGTWHCPRCLSGT